MCFDVCLQFIQVFGFDFEFFFWYLWLSEDGEFVFFVVFDFDNCFDNVYWFGFFWLIFQVEDLCLVRIDYCVFRYSFEVKIFGIQFY